jgi:TerC family integral membrane protein
LVASSAKILLFSEEEDDEDVSQNAIVKWVNSQSLVPATDAFDSEDPSKFFTLDSEGVRRATPLLAAVACLELSDIVFAVDSVPAVFGVSEDPFIVYTSNMFAILGLRAWYGVLSRAAQELVYLEKAVALVLGFVGAKLGAEYFGQEVSTETSLAVIFVILGAGVAASLLAPPPDDDESSSL